MIRRADRERLGRMEPGQDLVAAGYIGETGVLAIVRRKREELLSWFSPDYLEAIDTEQVTAPEFSREEWEALGATEYERTGEGGIMTALWTLSGTYQTGMSIELRAIPVRQSTIEVCERYGLNPYRLWSGGCAVLAADNGGRLVRELQARGIKAAVIGHVVPGPRKEICFGGECGCMERPKPDEIYRVLPEFAGSLV